MDDAAGGHALAAVDGRLSPDPPVGSADAMPTLRDIPGSYENIIVFIAPRDYQRRCMLRRPPPPTPRLPPFRLHYPTHAGNSGVSSIPPPYEMAFPPPRPKRKTHPRAFAAVLLASGGVVFVSGFYGVRQYNSARAREEQRTLIRNERIAETHALLSNVRDRFPLGLTEERACDPTSMPALAEGTRVPVLSFSQLRDGGTPSPGEAALQPTSFTVTKDTALDAPVVAVLMTTDASVGGGTYDGWLVLFDRNATPLCHARVVAKSGTSFADLENQLRGAEHAAAGRLSPKLALEF